MALGGAIRNEREDRARVEFCHPVIIILCHQIWENPPYRFFSENQV